MFNWIGAVVLFYHFQPSQTMTKQNFDLTQNFQHTFHLFEIHNLGEKQFIFIILKRKMIKRSWNLPEFWIPYSLLLFQLQTDRLKMAWHKGTWWPLAVKVKWHIELCSKIFICRFLFWFYLIFPGLLSLSKTVHTIRFFPRSGTVPRPPNTCLIHTGWQKIYQL